MCAWDGSRLALRSVYEEAYLEAERHRWIESEKRGYDVGDHAVSEWFNRFFLRFCWYRRLEHLEGVQAYSEFQMCYYGLLDELTAEAKQDVLVDRVLDRFLSGQENLQIIDWAHVWGVPAFAVLRVLERINMNEARLEYSCPVGCCS